MKKLHPGTMLFYSLLSLLSVVFTGFLRTYPENTSNVWKIAPHSRHCLSRMYRPSSRSAPRLTVDSPPQTGQSLDAFTVSIVRLPFPVNAHVIVRPSALLVLGALIPGGASSQLPGDKHVVAAVPASINGSSQRTNVPARFASLCTRHF